MIPLYWMEWVFWWVVIITAAVLFSVWVRPVCAGWIALLGIILSEWRRYRWLRRTSEKYKL